MRLLDRYLLRELLIPFGYCLAGFLIFWVVFNLFGELADFQKSNLNALDIAQYYLVKTPGDFAIVTPIALLLAMLYALTNHARHQELTAIRAAGVSLWRVATPYFAMGLLLSVALFALNEIWVPDSEEDAERILERHQPNQETPAARQWEHNFGFLNERAKRQWFAQAYNRVTHLMVRPHVEWIMLNGTRQVIYAERAFWRDGVWVFTNVQELVFSSTPGALPTPNETNLLLMPIFSETPEEIESQIKINRININSLRDVRKTQLSVREILDYKRLRLGNSRVDAILDTKLHGRLAAPWTCLVVVLIALPFGAASGRRNVFVGVASSLLICFTYFVLLQLGLALGTRGSLPPWLAAWAPNLLFGATGGLLTWRVR